MCPCFLKNISISIQFPFKRLFEEILLGIEIVLSCLYELLGSLLMFLSMFLSFSLSLFFSSIKDKMRPILVRTAETKIEFTDTQSRYSNRSSIPTTNTQKTPTFSSMRMRILTNIIPNYGNHKLACVKAWKLTRVL